MSVKSKNPIIWSSYQKDIFRNISKENGHLVVEALAGSSKTTTIIESFKYVPKGKKIIAIAFNKIIQKELEQRSPSYVTALTFHSVGLRAIKRRFGDVVIDDYKISNIIRDLFGKDIDYELINSLADTVSYCKYSLSDTSDKIEDIMYKFGIDTFDLEAPEFIKNVIQILKEDKKQTNIIDYNDMCWFPFVYNLDLGVYDYVFVDEVQDINASQAFIAKKLCNPVDGRIIATGDALQNIYSWRLSDTAFMEELKSTDNAKILSLPITYRCPKKIVELVKPWANDFQCPDTAKEGNIQEINVNKLYDIAKPGCFVLSRTNAPLIKICLNFIRNGIPANIRGRDIGKQLGNLLRKSKKKRIDAFLSWLDKYKDSEIEKLQKRRISTDSLMDRYECLKTLCEECKTVEEVQQKINELFNDTDEHKMVICSSTHKAKGLQRNNVFLLKWTYRMWFDNAEFIEKPNEEINIAYVACTRTQDNLYLVNKFI